MRLDIPAGTAVRFEPGEEKPVNLVEIGGDEIGVWLQQFDGGRKQDFDEVKARLDEWEALCKWPDVFCA